MTTRTDDPDDFDHDPDEEWDDRLEFADPGGRSALRAAGPGNPRNLPCPTCGEPNRLTRGRGWLGQGVLAMHPLSLAALLAAMPIADPPPLEPVNRSLAESATAWWQSALSGRILEGPGCYVGPEVEVFAGSSGGFSGTTYCAIPAGKPVLFPILTEACTSTQYPLAVPVGLLNCVAFKINAAAGLTFQRSDVPGITTYASGISGWRAQTYIFPAGPNVTAAADGYWTRQTFSPGTYTVRTTGCDARGCVLITYHLQVQ